MFTGININENVLQGMMKHYVFCSSETLGMHQRALHQTNMLILALVIIGVCECVLLYLSFKKKSLQS